MSSDSSDDEDLEKLREATDPQFINDALFDRSQSRIKEVPVQLPSLRRSHDEEQQFNLFGVSPEVRNYVAKHLSSMLDEDLKHKLGHYNDHMKPKRRKGGIKLLKSSPHCLKLKAIEAPSGPRVLHKKNSERLEESDDEERFKSVAVTPEDILNQKETKHWSNRSKAPVFTYTQTAEGLVLK